VVSHRIRANAELPVLISVAVPVTTNVTTKVTAKVTAVIPIMAVAIVVIAMIVAVAGVKMSAILISVPLLGSENCSSREDP
jgi:hypothetical protein